MKSAECTINVGVPADVLEQLDAMANKQFTTRSEIARSFLIDALYRASDNDEFVFLTLVTWAKSVKNRDGNKCAKCGGTEKLHAHHVRPVARGGKNTLENGITLCRQCHTAEHSLEFRGAGQERIAVGLKLPRWLVEWLRAQPESLTGLIEDALIEENKLKAPI